MNRMLPTCLLMLCFFCCGTAFAQTDSATAGYAVAEETESSGSGADSEIEEEESRSIGYRMLVYLPNRVLDLFDIVRLRARVGPGIGVGVRATEFVSADISSYATLYVGLPGPRREPTVKLPVGAELHSGLGISLLRIETDTAGPDYSSTEIGLDAQLLLVGGSVGIDPLEILDFFTGFVGIEVVEDDI